MSMRKSRKLISLAIAVVFLLSALVPAAAFAAGHADDQTAAGNRLRTLGVIEGFPDGSLGEERNITRAEMSVVLAKMSGNDSASRVLMNVPSTFSDVQTSVWYTGYINLASQQGWVAGYPDGTYKPNAPVSYAEVVTMMLNVLGYEGARLPGTWPSSYLVKAAQLGLTDGVSFTANAPALRGDVFIFVNEALSLEPVVWDADRNRYVAEVEDETLLDRLGFEVEEFRIVEYFGLLGSDDIDKEERTAVDTEDNDWTVAEGLCLIDYVGVETEFYVDDDVIVAVKSAERVIVGEVDTKNLGGLSGDIEIDDTWYTVADDAVYIVNREPVSFADVPDSGFVSFTRDAGRVITSITAVNYDAMRTVIGADEGGFGVVEEVVIDDNFIDIEMYVGDDANLDLDDVDAIYFYGVSSVDEIQEWDVVYWNQVEEDYAIYVVRDQVEGSLTRYRDGDFARIAGTNYDVSESAGDPDYWVTPDLGDNFYRYPVDGSDASFEDFTGEDVIGLLDGYGDLVVVVSDFEAADTVPNIALATSEIQRNKAFDTWTYRIRLLRANGTEARVNFEDDEVTVKIDGVAYPEALEELENWFELRYGVLATASDDLDGAVVEYSLNSEGQLDEINFLVVRDDSEAEDDEDFVGGKYVSRGLTGLEGKINLDEDQLALNRIRVGSVSYFVTSDTVFFEDYMDGDDRERRVLTWDEVQDFDGDYEARLYDEKGTGRDIVAFVFEEEAVGVDTDYAVLLDWWFEGGKVVIEVATENGIQTFATDYESSDITDVWQENAILDLLVTAGEAEIEKVVTNVYGRLPGSPYSSSRNTIKIADWADPDEVIELDLDADVLVVDNSGSTPRVISIGSVRRGSYVVGFFDDVEDGTLKVLVVIDQDDLPDASPLKSVTTWKSL